MRQGTAFSEAPSLRGMGSCKHTPNRDHYSRETQALHWRRETDRGEGCIPMGMVGLGEEDRLH